ncbi:DUF2523 family protein [Ferrimonas pelagia]|uniref:DUF2523 domain-containing protein n=1 Tax=Ferrimonas pelagia TaxID=1177826 RepID=A0ABP9F5S9_9GAMM
MDWLVQFFDWLGNGFVQIKEFFQFLPEIIDAFFIMLAKWAVLAWINIQIHTVQFGYAVAQEVLADFDAYGLVSTAFNSLPENILVVANAYGVPQCIRIIMDAIATRFVLTFMGW